MSKVRIALWCLVALVAIASLPFLRKGWNMRQHEKLLEQRTEKFLRNSPVDWAELGDSCRAYWELAKGARSDPTVNPALPPTLAQLTPLHLELEDRGFTLGWTSDYNNGTLYLQYSVALGRGSLLLICGDNVPVKKVVWSENLPDPRANAR